MPYGRVVGYDSHGNYKLKPEKGDRAVIIIDSSRLEFKKGERIHYHETLPAGKLVDFGIYRPQIGANNLQPSTIPLVRKLHDIITQKAQSKDPKPDLESTVGISSK